MAAGLLPTPPLSHTLPSPAPSPLPHPFPSCTAQSRVLPIWSDLPLHLPCPAPSCPAPPRAAPPESHAPPHCLVNSGLANYSPLLVSSHLACPFPLLCPLPTECCPPSSARGSSLGKPFPSGPSLPFICKNPREPSIAARAAHVLRERRPSIRAGSAPVARCRPAFPLPAWLTSLIC